MAGPGGPRALFGGPARRWRLRPAPTVALIAVLALLCCGGGTITFFLGGLGTDTPPTSSANGCGGNVVDPNGKLPDLPVADDEQMRNAAIIVQVGQEMKVPPRGWVIAVATAMQESTLHNLPDLGTRNDHDSLGLFQQRPSQGWGTPEQILDPRYAARKFYAKLIQIKGWTTMALTDAAQAVQNSAYPDAYAKHEPKATELVNVLTNGGARAAGDLVSLRCTSAGEVAASGWTVPLKAHIVSGFRTADRPGHNGIDLAAAKGTPIHAAAAGTVLVAKCNAVAPDGSSYSCDVDGSIAIGGCGWYVDLLHAGNVVTRYCHMRRAPYVKVGQRVSAGEVIGESGSSGNSSGPHLHFEVHLNGDQSSAGAVDPIPYMRGVGTPLGSTA